MSDTLTALVPMKGHSERIPGKNIKEFNGRPLFYWILTTLEMTPTIDEIIVNTDSDRISKGVREHFDVTVHERPQRIRGDEVSMNRIIEYDIDQTDSDWYLQTHCTNPLLSPRTIEDAFREFRNAEDFDSLFSVTPHRKFFWSQDQTPINHVNDERLTMTQKLEPLYEENSNMYFFSESSFRKKDNRIGESPKLYEMDEIEAVDIDEQADFDMAEYFHKEKFGEHPTTSEVRNVFDD
ncbi:acylneuraminate cytidylyltransferase family protein [Halorussus ruber]|uniref:acylneuraminate cytidylyltransferase family protein n=1 Tax=Halorussus ruber TaxID=1126238 RepID=UPI001092F880|nr:acylneuraminate cytidylyltransferase family protein [Halorussus ruber]